MRHKIGDVFQSFRTSDRKSFAYNRYELIEIGFLGMSYSRVTKFIGDEC